jgi:hypothetical protein
VAAGRAVPTHWLATNEREWTNAHALFVDTETRTERVGDDELLRLRLWAGRAVDRRELRKGRPADRWGGGADHAGLAAWVDAATVGNKATWLYCHNLGFDLTVSRLVDHLTGAGWALGEWSITDRAMWMRLSNGNRGLALCDSTTWLPVGLDEVGDRLGLAKLPLPDEGDDDEAWWWRCVRDVEILSGAMLELMAWWDRGRLGNWTVTGTGCGWNAMRHQLPKRAVLVRRGDGGEDAERAAIYGGRRDATRWGDVPGDMFATVDFEDCYPTVCRHLRLPAKRMAPFDSLPLARLQPTEGAIEYLARCTVTTDTPRYPLRWGGAVWYPVGTFETVLAHPELADAHARGELVAVGPGYAYWCDGHLAPWATWVLDLQHGRLADAPPVAGIPGKRWGRSVPGRFAQRVSERRHLGPAEALGWAALPGTDMGTGHRYHLVDLAGERYQVTRDVDADDVFPAVLAWVESHTRVRLNRMLEQLGEGAWLSCNTDGAVIDVRRAATRLQVPWAGQDGTRGAGRALGALCDILGASTGPLTPRPKATYSAMWLAGPQTLALDGRPLYAGVPKAATDDGRGRLEAHLWPGVSWQMANGSRAGYVRPAASYSVPAVTVHRWALVGGQAAPIQATMRAGQLEMGSCWATFGGNNGRYGLADEQSRAVRRLM